MRLTNGDAAGGRVPPTGIFWADDPEGFVRLLEDGMNVASERTPSGIVLKMKSR